MNPRRRARPTTPAAGMAAGFLALAVGLSGCGWQGESAEEPAPAGSAATGSASTETPSPHAAITEALESELGKLADSNSLPNGEAVAAAFTAAGFPAGSVEVSADSTPTGLEVDSIQAAAVQDGDCIFGEVRDGSAYVTVLPVLSDGGCFVGN
ncbi:DUF6993 domain-containing protein [Arthrobacter sp. zg-Y895]|uniref:DUF6993 domain-containing protein n=1 Tax=Arthrobacter sp. zg-Y895 TaxID=2886933 RepID=UPI001D146ADF|nr:hypothetical protein [Arthrobacter sp. zg-Y895]MCC3301148.1 hypothetical protein [Arthrobacter sp. zg-Y895]MCC3302395.1 hypothetical protein [Arthrobacter sp. zg-Y895]